ncbi:MAG: DUF4390 domain-containing protein [Lentisphaeria bacterium]|nr:DUF4390 domain-containing protein [Candidatus Neomarinimicrobiota bacterium]MCF7842337.1 DUF4390 domain-containing protein [Lentisphaeria bacterium]
MYNKIITTLLSLGTALFTNIQGVDAEFTNGLIEQDGQIIVASAELINCWTPELDRILRSGHPVKITYRLELFARENLRALTSQSIAHELRYSTLDDIFTIYRSETNQEVTVRSIENAKLVLAQLKRVGIINVDELVDDKTYYLTVSAALNRISLPGMDEELNLMAYWKGIRPDYRSEFFTKADFSQ